MNDNAVGLPHRGAPFRGQASLLQFSITFHIKKTIGDTL